MAQTTSEHTLPLPSPAPTPTLPAQINAATRKQHITLNKLLVERISLALPPNASDPTLYGMGLVAFAQVFHTFEAAWKDIQPTDHDETHAAEVKRWLSTVRPEGLERTTRLKNDLLHIWKGAELRLDPAITTERARLGQEIQAAISEKPHILIAYGWVMYMAIFSGGRWIREQLTAAGPKFWMTYLEDENTKRDVSARLGYSFLSFDGDEDGEDIKASFKAQLGEAETLLNEEERQEVVAAAKGLFDECVKLVGILDEAALRRPKDLFTTKTILLVSAVCTVAAVNFYAWWFRKLGYQKEE